uniref:Fc receptor like A n=1 Tax=Rhinolophus ferrumequinum TaxID=59479 RepID=A0A671F8N1_RHIFE
MLKTIRVFEAARELLAATMDLGGVLAAWAPFSPAVLWTAQMLLAAGCHAELFPVPVLRATPSAEAQEGDAVTLICQTKLPPQRSATHLLFSFHKDGQTVRGRSLSPELQIPVASAAHAGSYWCEATTEDSQVWKQSPRLEVRVQGPPSSAAPPALSPAPQESAAPGTTATDPSEPPPASPPPSSEGPGQSCPLQALDPHLHHQMGLLLKQMQDVTALLGHLVVELRDLSGRLKLETSKGRAKYE